VNQSVTLTLDVAAYAVGDVLADTQLVAASVGHAGKDVLLDWLKVEDDDDQGQPFDLVFLNANTSIGAENGVPNITDAAVAANVVSQLSIAAVDYVDLGGSRVAMKTNLGLPLLIPDKGSLYLAAISRGTGTYTANGIKVTLGIRYR
jgi:hypothetical protein